MSQRLVCLPFLIFATFHAQAQQTYPVVSKLEQKARDDDRTAVLESELAFERETLESAKSAFNSRPTNEGAAMVHRHDENVKALERELGGSEHRNTTEKPERHLVKAYRMTSRVQGAKRTANFWDPYNRAADTDILSTIPRRDSHE